ncbi:uncharacterized protein LOC110054223 [Orbicella faveolata]|uniref:uncharacterized protein LOC110054223 n=1 Tax=Orbicella faveolata TaxID=48498 RepID=UPI0009E4C924|nr:uncharacterized protein LOC110054223 [Orbicella faveolata]
MKVLFAVLIAVSLFAVAWSITCYRCGGVAPSCKSAGSATVECDDPSQPNFVYACRVYTVNYTSLDRVLEFKSCCLYEDCNDDPCKGFENRVCSKMASCQSDKCNSDYATAKASQQPTMPAKSHASGVVFHSLAGFLMALAVGLVL